MKGQIISLRHVLVSQRLPDPSAAFCSTVCVCVCASALNTSSTPASEAALVDQGCRLPFAPGVKNLPESALILQVYCFTTASKNVRFRALGKRVCVSVRVCCVCKEKWFDQKLWPRFKQTACTLKNLGEPET